MRGRTNTAALRVGAVAAAAVLALAGCGGDDTDDPDDPDDAADGPAASGPTTPGSTESTPGSTESEDDDPDAEDDPDGEGDDETNADGGEVAPAAFNDDGASGTYACDAQDIAVNGEDAEVHLTGACGVVVVNGVGSDVTVDDAERIVVNVDAHVTYSGDPDVTLNSDDASAEEA